MGRLSQLLVLLFVLGLDQYTKHLAYTELTLGVPVSVVPGLFNLTLVYNPGAAFGMFGALPDDVRRVTLATVSILALLVISRFLKDEFYSGDKLTKISLLFILGGALGNIIDRARFDSVVDFLDFYIGSYHWPAFNVADSAICVGVAILLIRLTFFHHAKGNDAVEPSGQFPKTSAERQVG